MGLYKITDVFRGKIRGYLSLTTDASRNSWMFKDAFNRPYKYCIAQRLVDSLYRGGMLLQSSPRAFISTERPVVFR